MINAYFIGSFLCLAALYMTAATGVSLCLKNGEFNLGGEGQIYAGGFICAIILNATTTLPPPVSMLLALCGAMGVPAILTAISAALKLFKNISFLLSSFIISSAVIPLTDGLISGPFRGSSAHLLATNFIQKNVRFVSIMKPSPFNGYFFAAILICIGMWYVINKTKFGKQICLFGTSPAFASYTGFSEKQITISTAAISGALHGLTGAAAVCGSYYTCHLGFYAGMGWNAFAVAMIAKANPLLVIPAGLFMALLITTATRIATMNNFDFDISMLIQAIVIFVIAIPFTVKKIHGGKK